MEFYKVFISMLNIYGIVYGVNFNAKYLWNCITRPYVNRLFYVRKPLHAKFETCFCEHMFIQKRN